MAKRKYSKEEQEKTGKYHDAFEAREELYKLIKEVVYATGYGDEDEDYTKTINLNVGGGALSYDPYYQKLTYYDDKEDCEYDVEEDDLETVQNLIEEIKRRFEAFEKRVSRTRNKAASEFFDTPIKNIIRGGKDD